LQDLFLRFSASARERNLLLLVGVDPNDSLKRSQEILAGCSALTECNAAFEFSHVAKDVLHSDVDLAGFALAVCKARDFSPYECRGVLRVKKITPA